MRRKSAIDPASTLPAMPLRPEITPAPRNAPGALPFVGHGLRILRDATGYLARERSRSGDTFETDFFGRRILWVFSPVGVRSLWALPERSASKGAADVEMLRQKVPDELFAGRRTIPHMLFARDDVARYLANLERAVDLSCDELGPRGRLEAFAWTRRLGHRVGLASWAGVEAAEPRFLDRLVPWLERLDGADAFVHPQRMLWTRLSGKRAERQALLALDDLLGEVLDARERVGGERDDLMAQILAAWQNTEGDERRRGIARDVVLVHLASMSNLFAAMGWTLVHLLDHPDVLERVRGGEPGLMDACASESIRLMQRSVVLRKVLRPTVLQDEHTEYTVAPGAFIATMMSVTNRSAAAGLERYDPAHFAGRRFALRGSLPVPELVTTFGHGAHSCPAQSFSLRSIAHAVTTLVQRFELTPRYRDPQPLRRQLGGVARADRACRVEYVRRGAQPILAP